MRFLQELRTTIPNKGLAITRIFLSIIFLSAGLTKLVAPQFRDVFASQLSHASIPFQAFNLWFVPIVETLVGLMLLVGLFARLASVAALLMMLVAGYVHIVVKDPALFPLQPEAPVIPLIVIALCTDVLWRGAGSRSLDLRSSVAADLTD